MQITFNTKQKTNSHYKPQIKQNNADKKASFGGVGSILTAGLQACEQHPMIGVSVIDAATCIIPRAAVDFHTNAHAGLETLRRESSGLLVNCLLPSYFVMGVAAFLQYITLPKEYRNLKMSGSWADEHSIRKLAAYYKESTKNVPTEEKSNAFVKSVLSDLQGFNSSEDTKWIKYASTGAPFEKSVNALSKAIKGKNNPQKAINEAYKLLSAATNATETIKFTNETSAFGSNLSAILRDIVDMGKKFQTPAVEKNIDNFVESAVKFVNHKSFAGLALIIPLAASMQYINRWITRKHSGIKGAPIYRDFGSENKPKKDSETKLFSHKIAGASAMIGLAIASMMKKPTKQMFQFKGLFPTLDQARWIAAITFASRILAAEDCNEVRETTVRDMAGFASLYFLGDYIAKALATTMNKINPKIDLINKHKELAPKSNVFAKFGNWIKNQSLKSFDEVPKEFKTHRAICQATSLGASMLLLGLFIPIWSRKQTEKNEKKRLASTNPQTPLATGPESTASLLWHKWQEHSQNNTFGRFEKLVNFK